MLPPATCCVPELRARLCRHRPACTEHWRGLCQHCQTCQLLLAQVLVAWEGELCWKAGLRVPCCELQQEGKLQLVWGLPVLGRRQRLLAAVGFCCGMGRMCLTALLPAERAGLSCQQGMVSREPWHGRRVLLQHGSCGCCLYVAGSPGRTGEGLEAVTSVMKGERGGEPVGRVTANSPCS